MTNAKDEFWELLKDQKYDRDDVVAARLIFGKNYSGQQKPINFDKGDSFDAFLQALNFEYDAGFGSQELDGVIWFADGTWAERGEYDGSEWWEHRVRPEIPQKEQA